MDGEATNENLNHEEETLLRSRTYVSSSIEESTTSENSRKKKKTPKGGDFDWSSIPKYLTTAKRPKNSPLKSFFLMIYLLYFRYTVELGISVLTYPEALIVNSLLGFLIFSVVNQGSRFIFNVFIWTWKLIKVFYWAYDNLGDEKSK